VGRIDARVRVDDPADFVDPLKLLPGSRIRDLRLALETTGR
jgi:hypothetical protein